MKMSKADKMLLDCGFKKVDSSLSDWVDYRNENDVLITFEKETQFMYCGYEFNYSPELVSAINEKMKELGWFNE